MPPAFDEDGMPGSCVVPTVTVGGPMLYRRFVRRYTVGKFWLIQSSNFPKAFLAKLVHLPGVLQEMRLLLDHPDPVHLDSLTRV